MRPTFGAVATTKYNNAHDPMYMCVSMQERSWRNAARKSTTRKGSREGKGESCANQGKKGSKTEGGSGCPKEKKKAIKKKLKKTGKIPKQGEKTTSGGGYILRDNLTEGERHATFGCTL